MFNDIYREKKVLITGHTGFKGSWLTQWLLKLGANVAGYSLYIPSEPSNYRVLALSGQIKDYQGDVRDLDSLQRAFKEFSPEIVFHLAAQAIVSTSYEDPAMTFQTNVDGMVNVLETIRTSSSTKVAVLITSDKCYENVEWEYGYRENDRLGGKDPYSASKACAEIVFSSYQRSFFSNESSPKIATTRAGNVIGGGDWAKNRIVPDCIRSWASGNTVTVRSPHSTRPWQHVLEPLSGYLWLAAQLYQDSPHLNGESFNFGPSSEVTQSVIELIHEIQKVWTDGRCQIEALKSNSKNEAGLLKLCCDKALNRLKWKPTFTYQETVRLTAEWYKRFYENNVPMDDFSINQIKFYENLAEERGLSWALS